MRTIKTIKKIPNKEKILNLANVKLRLNDIYEELDINLQYGTKSYKLNKDTIRLKSIRGCYEWFGIDGNKSYYVGMASNIRSRIREHIIKDSIYSPFNMSFKDTNGNLGVRIWYCENIMMIEGLLTSVLKPKHNILKNGVPCIFCDTGILIPINNGEAIQCIDCKKLWVISEQSIGEQLIKQKEGKTCQK